MRPLAPILACALLLSGVASAQSDMGSQPEIDRGKIVYDKYCSQCHGYDGDGQGYATSRVLPVPRDFTAGKYKFRTTASGKLPTDADLIKVIKDGLPYTDYAPAYRLNCKKAFYHLNNFLSGQSRFPWETLLR